MKTQQMQKGLMPNPQSGTDAKNDNFQEKLLRQLWLAIVEDLYPLHVAKQCRWYFDDHGIVEIIEAGCAVADYFLYGGDRPGNVFMLCYDSTDFDVPSSIRTLLFVTRFGKRYTPWQRPSTISDFWENNSRVGAWDDNRSTLLKWLQRILTDMLEHYSPDPEKWTFSTGADYDGSKHLGDKILAAERVYPMLLGPTLGTPIDNVLNGTVEPYHYNRVKAVPKNYKKVRNIAMEPQWLNVAAAPIALAIESCLPVYANIHDQTMNMDLARKGSLDNSLSTIDLSAASDSIARKLCAHVLPSQVYDDIIAVTSYSETPRKDNWGRPKVKYDASFGMVETTRQYHMISTMGNRVTFPLETLLFSGILELTATIVGARTSPDYCGVYGDDIICPTEWVPTLLDLLRSFGFLPNNEKSFFGEEYFRESCGGEYYKGCDVSSVYWPRKALSKDNAYPSLVSLQHKLYMLPEANRILCTWIRGLVPKVTESLVGSPYDDIWSVYPNLKKAYGSYAKGHSEPDPSCEVHSTIEPDIQKEYRQWHEAIERYRYYTFLKYGHRPNKDDVLAAVGYPEYGPTDWTPVHPTLKVVNRKYLV